MPLLVFLIAVEIAIIIKLFRDANPPPLRTKSIDVRFNPQGASKMADLVLQVGQSSTGTVVPFLADGTTPTPGAVVSAQAWTISDPALTVVNNPDGTVTVTGTAATTTPAQGTVSATVTDSDGTVGQFTATFTITVGGVGPVNRTASIGASWSTPS